MSKSKKTKSETLRAMLARRQGATIAALAKATGWQPHSLRAALSGLRKAGYEITRETGAAKTGAVYRISRTPEAAE